MRGSDGSQTVAAGDARAADSWRSDAAVDLLALPADLARAEASPAAEAGPDLPPGCTPLDLVPLAMPAAAACPPTRDTPECASSDLGAIVARSPSCSASWGNVRFQCQTWPAIAADQELLVLTVRSCQDLVRIGVAMACPDHIVIDWVDHPTCGDCAYTPTAWHPFVLPLDPRPIVATVTYDPAPPCFPLAAQGPRRIVPSVRSTGSSPNQR